MKLSSHDFPGIKFIDFHTHCKPAPSTVGTASEILKIISFELADFVNNPPETSPNIFFSVGLHPWRLPDDKQNLESELETLGWIAENSDVIALGEAGLDRLKGPDMRIQNTCFTEILKLSVKLGKPLITHCVRCYPELISLKKQFAPDSKILVHGYNGNLQILKELFKHGFYVSFGMAALKREDLCAYARQNPDILCRLCLETDASDITIQEVFACAARELGLDIERLSLIMKTNFISLFQESENA